MTTDESLTSSIMRIKESTTRLTTDIEVIEDSPLHVDMTSTNPSVLVSDISPPDWKLCTDVGINTVEVNDDEEENTYLTTITVNEDDVTGLGIYDDSVPPSDNFPAQGWRF